MPDSTTNKTVMDGCTAAAYVAYALSEVATIYPITPIASMGETADKWIQQGRTNVFGSKLSLHEMESELGAAGATHGALVAGALATTFTSSQGLMLMIPNMYKISGELLPGVFHVGTRSMAAHALSIFGDHQDVMACRATGFTFLASSSVQETMDLALVAHLAAIEGSLPIVHFFDGWRTSNELSTISTIAYSDMAKLVDWDKVKAFRARALNPEHPTLKGSAQNSDVYFQNREGANRLYDQFPTIVQQAMDKVGTLTGRSYHLVDYVGDPQAEYVMIAIGSACKVAEQTVNYLNSKGEKTGLVNIRLYRPFPSDALLASLPSTVKRIAVMDRTKEPGSGGEPLFQDVATAIQESGRNIMLIGGRYGLSSKAFTPQMAKAVFDELASESPRRRFTVGINDDVTHLSLDVDESATISTDPQLRQVIFYGMGSDGTVGATRQLTNIIGGADTPLQAQTYYNYSAKKSGGYTTSELRYSPSPILAEYPIEQADYIGCNKDVYVSRFKMVNKLRPGGTFVVNCQWTDDELDSQLPADMKRQIAQKKIRLYTVNAKKIAEANGLGVRINTVMATVFLKLSDSQLLPFEQTIEKFKDLVKSTYDHEGGAVVANNMAVIDAAVDSIHEISYPASWAVAADGNEPSQDNVPTFIRNVAQPCLKLLGNELPVSALTADGTMPMGTTAYEKRRIANNIPAWDPQKCIQCTLCSYVCAHAAIRPYLLNADELAKAPATLTSVKAKGPQAVATMNYRIQVYPDDCTGCSSCSVICPGKALTMVPIDTIHDQQAEMLDFVQHNVSIKDNIFSRSTVKGTQLYQPLLEFSGACAGCGETPYVKLLTQLFGERMIIANATGCSSIWGANFPSNAYCTNRFGKGPAWGNSLFEDNAEYGFGMVCATDLRRKAILEAANSLTDDANAPANLKAAAQAWISSFNDPQTSATTGEQLAKLASAYTTSHNAALIAANADMLGKKSIWAIGGDGWAYDIGFAGLDHVLAQNVDINILVMDTECYSNTGGQMSKATPYSVVAKYASTGKRTFKKDLGRMMMTYGNVYVASISLGANYQQTVDALIEAEAYPGPSIVIAYCPCINHGIRNGMGHSIVEEKMAVKSGYWPLYRYMPRQATTPGGKLTVDEQAPDDSMPQMLTTEDRWADLQMVAPTDAAAMQTALQQRGKEIYSIIVNRSASNLF